jgi:solute carrier family 27 fatty acid transporter 1/4
MSTAKKCAKKRMNIFDVFDTVVEKHPDKAAVIFQSQRWTFAQLQDFTVRVANFFTDEGLKEGDSIALFVHNCPEQIGTWLGLARIGVRSALINYSLRKDVLVHSVGVTKPKAIVFSSSLYTALSEVRDSLVEELGEDLKFYCIDGPVEGEGVIDLTSQLRTVSTQPVKERGTKAFDEMLMYIYTSGTTGFPKAAKITNQRYYQSSLAFSFLLSIKPSDVVYVSLPMYHSSATLIGINQMVVTGCTVVIREKFSASHFWEDCIEHKCTVALYIGEICRYLLNQPEKPTDSQHSVRLMIGNGLKRGFHKQFTKRFHVSQIGEFYASTEGTAAFLNTENHPGACGFIPLMLKSPNVLLKIDPVTGDIVRDSNGLCSHCPPGEPGLLVGLIMNIGLQRFSGYHNESETNKKILRDVFKKGDSYFNTGDLLMMDEEGYVYFCDRTGDTFRWKGENVSTFEVESVMSKQLENRDVIVYGVEVPGCEGRAGMAAIVDPENDVAMEELFPTLVDHLPSYAIPLFIRKIKEPYLTGTKKFQKVKMRNEGFDIGAISDPLYFLHPKHKSYVLLTEEVCAELKDRHFRL